MNEHSNCGTLLSSLSDFIDGELSDIVCREIEQHLQECENCAVFVDTMKKTIYLYRKSDESADHVPDEVMKRLYKKLDLEDYSK